MKHLHIFIIFNVFLLCFPSEVFGQRTISGNVSDASGDPLPFANVFIEGTTIGIITDIDGNFTLNIPQKSQYITVSYTGYNDKTFKITDRNYYEFVIKGGRGKSKGRKSKTMASTKKVAKGKSISVDFRKIDRTKPCVFIEEDQQILCRDYSGIDKLDKESIKDLASQKDNEQALFTLGKLVENKLYSKGTLKEAKKYYNKANSTENAKLSSEVKRHLANIYFKENEKSKAMDLLKASAEQGNKKSVSDLAKIHFYGWKGEYIMDDFVKFASYLNKYEHGKTLINTYTENWINLREVDLDVVAEFLDDDALNNYHSKFINQLVNSKKRPNVADFQNAFTNDNNFITFLSKIEAKELDKKHIKEYVDEWIQDNPITVKNFDNISATYTAILKNPILREFNIYLVNEIVKATKNDLQLVKVQGALMRGSVDEKTTTTMHQRIIERLKFKSKKELAEYHQIIINNGLKNIEKFSLHPIFEGELSNKLRSDRRSITNLNEFNSKLKEYANEYRSKEQCKYLNCDDVLKSYFGILCIEINVRYINAEARYGEQCGYKDIANLSAIAAEEIDDYYDNNLSYFLEGFAKTYAIYSNWQNVNITAESQGKGIDYSQHFSDVVTDLVENEYVQTSFRKMLGREAFKEYIPKGDKILAVSDVYSILSGNEYVKCVKEKINLSCSVENIIKQQTKK